MSILILGPLLALTALGVVVALVVGLVRATGSAPGNLFSAPGVAAVAHHLRRWRLLTLLVSLTLGFLVLQWGNRTNASMGRWASLAPGLVMIALLVGTAIGEATSPQQRAVVRSASLAVRRPFDAVGRRQATFTAGGLLVLAGVLVFAGSRAVPDRAGRAGRAILVESCSFAQGREVITEGLRTPFPGTWYSLPIAVVFAVGLALAGLVLWLIARRPRPAVEGRPYDDELRRWSSAQVLHAVGLGTAATLWPVSAVVASGVDGSRGCGDSGLAVLPGVFVVIALAALVWFLVELVQLFVGPRRVLVDAARPAPSDPVAR